MVEDPPEPCVNVFHGLEKIIIVHQITATMLPRVLLFFFFSLLFFALRLCGGSHYTILILCWRLRCQINRVNTKLSFRSARRQLACPVLSAPRVVLVRLRRNS
jgi:hypothetical protein